MVDYDVIVLGLGCAGLASCVELADRGCDVLGLEQHSIVNEYGSSHGDIRLFRFAYHEGEAYVPLLYESVEKWESLEPYAEGRVFEDNGSVTIGYDGSEKLQDARATCESEGIDYELFTGSEFSDQFEMWDLPDEMTALYQGDGGVLYSGRGLRAMKEQASEKGVDVETQVSVDEWEADETGVSVVVDGEVVTGDSLVVTTGPWAADIPELSELLTVERHLVSFLEYSGVSGFSSDNAPVWVFDGGKDNRFYGSPSVSGSSEVKLGYLSGDTSASISDFRREWSVGELRPELLFAREQFSVQPRSVRGEVCPLTHTPDGDFVIDESEEYSNVFYGVGLSGHGMKLAPAIGRLVGECVVDGETEDKFSLRRFTGGSE